MKLGAKVGFALVGRVYAAFELTQLYAPSIPTPFEASSSSFRHLASDPVFPTPEMNDSSKPKKIDFFYVSLCQNALLGLLQIEDI